MPRLTDPQKRSNFLLDLAEAGEDAKPSITMSAFLTYITRGDLPLAIYIFYHPVGGQSFSASKGLFSFYLTID
jgi:hypothetical protein